MDLEIIKTGESLPAISPEECALLSKELIKVREEIRDCPYLVEAVKVLPVQGYRSAIGAYWNSVVDDLRKKILHRSIDLFNKEMNPKNKVERYEDFQNYITDYDLVEGAYKIGVLNWEGHKLMHQARQIRNMFYGHPQTSEPDLIKVLNLFSDCNRYVLCEEYPPSIIDISTYLSQMDSSTYDRNEIAVEQAFADLPAIYKSELSNRFFDTYLANKTSSELRASIEFCAPILWGIITKEDRKQIGKRFDKLVIEGDKLIISKGLDYIKLVAGMMYVNIASRKAVITPIVEKLVISLDDWGAEASLTKELLPLSKFIPEDSLEAFVRSITRTFVGYKGSSARYSRKDFYSDMAAPNIEVMFRRFDTKSTDIFVEVIKFDEKLKRRIQDHGQLRRLRILGNILLKNNVGSDESLSLIDLLCDESRESKFYGTVLAI